MAILKKSKRPKYELIVKDILQRFPEARNDDFILYAFTIEMLGYASHLLTLDFMTFLVQARRNKLPSFETITRVRRKVQEKCPELRCDEKTDKIRFENFKETLEWE